MTFQNDRAGPAAAPFRWCPIRALAPRHRARILTHLLALDEADRHLRFGYAASDSHVGRYVDQLDFERDEVYGVFNRRLELVAMARLAVSLPILPTPIRPRVLPPISSPSKDFLSHFSAFIEAVALYMERARANM